MSCVLFCLVFESVYLSRYLLGLISRLCREGNDYKIKGCVNNFLINYNISFLHKVSSENIPFVNNIDILRCLLRKNILNINSTQTYSVNLYLIILMLCNVCCIMYVYAIEAGISKAYWRFSFQKITGLIWTTTMPLPLHPWLLGASF